MSFVNFDKKDRCCDVACDNLVSIIVPFYNRVELVLQSVRSVQEQTYKNWELILVNDGSTENISGIADSVASDSRLRFINSNHVGASNARNLGIDSSTGRYIAFLDSDDLWDFQKLEKQIGFMLENNYSLSHTNYNRMSFDGKLLAKIDLSDLSGNIFSKCLYSCRIATPCVIVEREFLGDLRFPLDIGYGEDVCLWLELAWRGNWGLLQEPLTHVRVGDSSAYQDDYKQQLGGAEVLRYALKNPDWAAYQAELRIAAQCLASLFSKSSASKDTNTKHKAHRNFTGQLYRALKRHGIIGVFKILYRRIKPN